MNVLDLFSGIGGFSLGLERAGMRTVAFCEIDPFCRAVLKKHWPQIPCYRDITTLNVSEYGNGIVALHEGRIATDPELGCKHKEKQIPTGWEGTRLLSRVDVICGGFPCQDISVAGKGAGIEGERSGLWSEYARIIGEVRPRYVIVENVAALLGRGLERVLGDLAALGFDAEWHCIPASAVGAPHRRDRVWIVANASERRCSGEDEREIQQPGRAEIIGGSEDVADSAQQRINGSGNAGSARWNEFADSGSIPYPAHYASISDGIRRGDAVGQWGSKPRLGQPADGLSPRLDGGLDAASTHQNRPRPLSDLQCGDYPQNLQRQAGGKVEFLPQDLLRQGMHGGGYEEGYRDAKRLSVAGQETEEGGLRGMRRDETIACSPLRWEPSEQRPDQSPNSMPILSRFLACALEEARTSNFWSGSCTYPNEWEQGIPRVARGVPARVDRLRSLGNAIVPQIAEIIGKAIMEHDHELRG